jgi:cell division septation protein DedD
VHGKRYFRVRAGPYATREEADHMATLAQRKAGVSGRVIMGR